MSIKFFLEKRNSSSTYLGIYEYAKPNSDAYSKVLSGHTPVVTSGLTLSHVVSRLDKLVYVGINEDRPSQLQVLQAVLRK